MQNDEIATLKAELERRKAEAERQFVEAEMAKRRLSSFLKQAWHVVETTSPLMWSWHLDAMCEHLEAVTKGQIKNLCITIPPGCTKPCYTGGMITERTKGTIPLGSVCVGDFVLTHMGRFRRVDAVHEQGVLPVLEITTHNGRVLKVESSHPLLTTRGWVEAKDLTTNDVLAEVHKTEPCGTGTVSVEEARVLGYLIGDGAVKYGETSFTNQDPEAVADFIQCVESIGFKTTTGTRKGKFASISKVCVISGLPRKGVKRNKRSGVRKWRQQHGIDGKCSYDKEVPAAIFAGTDEIVAEFVAAYWSCDGLIQDRRDLPRSGRNNQTTQAVRINCTTVSKSLARGLQRLLTRLGMSFRLRSKTTNKVSKRQGDKYTSWMLEANGQDTAAKFMHVIGPRMRHEKRRRAGGMIRKSFDRVLNPDPVVSIRESGDLECRCLTVEEDHSFVYEDLAVHNSILVSVMWPAWTWASNPGVRWLCAANESDLATRDSLSCRKVLQSDWYQSRFPNVQLVSDQNVKTWYQTKEGGHRLATTVSSNVTGKKGDILLCFPGDTMIQTESGQVAISEIADNPTEYRVATYNHETDAIEYHTPSRSFHNKTQELIVIETDDGREIECTPEHPIYVIWKGYISATNVQKVDKLLSHRNKVGESVGVATVKSVRRVAKQCPVYNIATGPHNNYFANGILVHNCDDPNDAKKVFSMAERKAVQAWWDGAFYDRVNDFMTGRRVIIGQRTHREDLIGYVLATGEFEELRIPEEFVPSKKYITSIGWTDPRTEEGELLRPDRFGPVQVDAAKKKPNYSAKHQQDPKDIEGSKFKAEWLKKWYWDTDRDNIVLEDARGTYKFKFSTAQLFATCDPAASAKKTADYTVISIWANTPRGDLIWIDCYRRQVEIPDQPKLLQEVYDKYRFNFIGIEAVASNASMYQFAQRMNLNALKCTPKGQDKLTHAQGAIILAESGLLWLPAPNEVRNFPLEEVVNEIVSFTGTPQDEHDDALDTLSYACDIRPRLVYTGGATERPGWYDTRKSTIRRS